MEVVLNADIARLVLGYLRDQKLYIVSAKFCKYSPYLSEENEILRKGLIPVSIKHDNLVQIVREYCYINSKISKAIEIFPQNVREAFAKQNLIGKISYLLKLAKKNLNTNISTIDASFKSDNTNISNNRKKKRRRSQISLDTSTSSIETTQVKDLPGYCPSATKKRRISGLYCFLHDAQSASSEDTSSEDIIDELPVSAETSTSTIITNQNLSNIQTTDSTLQPTTSFSLNQNNEPPVVIDTPKPKSTIVFKTTNSNQINNNNITLQTSAPSQLNMNEQNVNTICNSSSLIDPNFSISKLIIMNSNDATTTDSIFNTNTGLSPFAAGEQVFIDLGTGQTFPFLMSNDGMNCMLINRNDIESNNCQPIFLTNSTITTIETDESKNQQQSLNKSINYDKQVAQSVDSKLMKDNSTPDNNTIINQPATRSLSTPRRKSSHVRVLNFSPLTKFTEKSSSNQISVVQQPNRQQIVSNQPIIESVQILPQLQKPFIPTFTVPGPQSHQQTIPIAPPPAATVTESVSVDNDCSNSNSTDLTGGDHSNVTVIQRINIDTPRRKRNLRSCKRVLSQSNSEDGKITKTAKKKKNISPPNNKKTPKTNSVRKKTKPVKEEENIEKVIEEKDIDPMEEWRQMRLKTKSNNFDQHLREVASKTPTVGHFRNHSKRRKRRKIGGNVNRDDDIIYQTDIIDDDSPDDSSTEYNKDSNEIFDNEKTERKEIVTTKPMTIKTESKTLLNFKIKTPIKKHYGKQIVKTNKKMKSPIKKVIMSKKKLSEIEQNQEIVVQDENHVKICESLSINIPTKTIESTLKTNTITDQEPQSSTSYVVPSTITKEREKRTANIAHLLETPFKVESVLFPITPKFIEPQINDTPATKLQPISTFSTLKHLDIKTPAFAITPGFGLTPADKETPKSGCLSGIQTDYSSGGSYYRPDESEDLDKQLDRKLNAEMRRRRLKTPAVDTASISNKPVQIISKEKEKSTENDNNKTDCEKIEHKNETTPEMIVPCPVVLEKVKSFGDEKPNFIPHYKFSDALPELTDETSTSSSSSSSSSSSPSSASSKSSNSSSSSSGSSSNKSKKSLFSVIDSSEDEEWDIQSKEKIKKLNEENTQLVTNDGEVRFPVRSWITPKKPDEPTTPQISTPSTTKIPNNSMMTIYDEKAKQKSELEQKRQRIKEQLAEDFKNTNQSKKTSPIKRPPISKIKKYENKIDKSSRNEKIFEEKSPENRKNEVLTALNLSARKKPIDEQQQQNKQKNSNIVSHLDDNATSDVFINKLDDNNSQHSSAESLKIRNAALALTTLSMQQKKKLTVSIDPLPMKHMMKKIRGRPRKNEETDNKINKIKREKMKKVPLKPLSIRLRRETRSSPVTLKECEKELKKLPNEQTKKYDKNDAIKKPISNEEILKPNKLEQEVINKIKKERIESQPSTSKCPPSMPPIQTAEIRSSVEQTDLSTKLKSNQPISSTSKSAEEIVQVRSAKDSSKNLNRIESNEENIIDGQNNNDDVEAGSTDDSEEEDPYEACELIKSENVVSKTIIYSGSDDYCPEIINNQFNLQNAIMNINLDGILHKLECTNEISLFSMEPKLKLSNENIVIKKQNKRIKSMPKKRERNLKIISNVKSPELSSETNELHPPQNTSTPHLPKFKISHKDKFLDNKEKHSSTLKASTKNLKNKNQLPSTSSESCNSGNKVETDKHVPSDVVSTSVSATNPTASKSMAKTTSTIVSGQENLGKNIRAEDITAVLSHLHGSEEQ